MKLTLLQRRIQAWYLCGGLVGLAVNLLLASTSLGQFADTRIAFMSTRSERNGEIFLMNPDGKRVRRLTKHPEYDSAPAWSPDGQKITFLSYRDLNRIEAGGIILSEIYVMNPDGTNPINLTQSVERPDGVSSWSPDGKQIAFTSAEFFKWDILFHSDIWVMDADGGNPRNSNHHASEYWSPDGMAFTSDRNWTGNSRSEKNWDYVMNLTIPLITPNHQKVVPIGHRMGIRLHSPLTATGTGNSRSRLRNWEVYVMNADGS